MKCPRCKKHIDYPTQRQFLAWFYRYVYEYDVNQVAQIMNITPRGVNYLIRRFEKCWPEMVTKPRKADPSIVHFQQDLHSTPKIQF